MLSPEVLAGRLAGVLQNNLFPFRLPYRRRAAPVGSFRNIRQAAAIFSAKTIQANESCSRKTSRRAGPPLSPDQIVERAKKAVFSLKTPKGKGTGFLLSSDGIVVAPTGIIGLNQEAEVLVPSQGEKKGVVLKNLRLPGHLS
jgi:hypothetical protein